MSTNSIKPFPIEHGDYPLVGGAPCVQLPSRFLLSAHASVLRAMQALCDLLSTVWKGDHWRLVPGGHA